MDKENLSKFSRFLTVRRDTLASWLKSGKEKQAACMEQCSVQEVEEIVMEHDKAIDNIEAGSFGECTQCDEGVEIERLELDFTTSVCLDHYSDSQKRLLERDLELAAKVQRQLLPHTVPALSGARISAHTEPAQVVGGDYFDFFAYPNGHQGITIADVMGKGLSASMLMSNVQASLRILGPEHPQLDALAKRLNELFLHNIKLVSFISMFLLRIDEAAGILHYCNAGHNPAILWQAAARTMDWLKPTGPAIGLTKHAVFKSKEVNFSPGDVLLMYTDGLIEAQNSKGEDFGKERLTAFVEKHNHLSTDAFLTELRESARDFAGEFHDDVTLVVIKKENI
jgi:sigma-B regulation protein RsbU (phosphoserine phosphatase)